MTAPTYSSFTFPTADAMSYTGFNGNDAYWGLYSEPDWTQYVNDVSAGAALLGGIIGSAIAEGIKDQTDGYTLATRFTFDKSGLIGLNTRGTCISVTGKQIRCVTTSYEPLTTITTPVIYKGDLAGGATTPANGVNIFTSYDIVTQTSSYATAQWFGCESEVSGNDVTSTCYLMQIPEDQESDTNYRFDMESP